MVTVNGVLIVEVGFLFVVGARGDIMSADAQSVTEKPTLCVGLCPHRLRQRTQAANGTQSVAFSEGAR